MIRYSIETLWHFNCEACGKWWSIGDHQISGARVHGETLTCPHCGTKAELAPAEPLETTEPVQAKVDADGWIEWKDGHMPVKHDTLVEVRYRDNSTEIACAECFFWEWLNYRNNYDIIAYRVVKE